MVAHLSLGVSNEKIVASVLIGYALLQSLLLLRLARWLGEQPFTLSYWALTFGTVALATVLIKLPTTAGSQAMLILTPVGFRSTNVIVLILTVRTLLLVAKFALFSSLAVCGGEREIAVEGSTTKPFRPGAWSR